MTYSNDPEGRADLFDIWAYKRIIDGKKCHLDDDAVCLPVYERDCKTCYQKDISKKETGEEI